MFYESKKGLSIEEANYAYIDKYGNLKASERPEPKYDGGFSLDIRGRGLVHHAGNFVISEPKSYSEERIYYVFDLKRKADGDFYCDDGMALMYRHTEYMDLYREIEKVKKDLVSKK